MLSVHGVVIIATEIFKEYRSNKSTSLSLWVSSESRDKGKKEMFRFPINIWVQNDQVEEARKQLEVGRVCEIVKCNIEPLKNIVLDQTKTYAPITFSAGWTDIKVMNSCVYYQGIPGITIKETDGS